MHMVDVAARIVRSRAAIGSGIVAGYWRLSLAHRFLLANLVIVGIATVVTGVWVSQQIESGELNHTAAITALYVDSIVSPHLQVLSRQPRLDPGDAQALDRLVAGTSLGQHVVSFKVWSPDGQILYSPKPELIGQRFDDEGGLPQALTGQVVAAISDLSERSNAHERAHWSRLVEVYAPVRQDAGGAILAVTEFYMLPDDVEAGAAAARLRSWVVVATIGVVTYLVMAGIVKRGSDTIDRQQAALARHVGELERLLEQNARLHERVHQAAGRTTTLNEQALRRISADLHDGPGQALALALLRLDALRRPSAFAGNGMATDFEVVQSAVRDALSEVRAISAGLRLPELAPLSVAEVATRAVRDHEHRSGTRVGLHVHEPLPDATLPVKIAVLRTLQEALSNATRHGGGVDVRVELWSEDGWLCLTVCDRGSGFVQDQGEVAGHLGLAGMRERAELLGGGFRIQSSLGHGTTVRVWWPVG
jgi:signal transduction histidine kinase